MVSTHLGKENHSFQLIWEGEIKVEHKQGGNDGDKTDENVQDNTSRDAVCVTEPQIET